MRLPGWRRGGEDDGDTRADPSTLIHVTRGTALPEESEGTPVRTTEPRDQESTLVRSLRTKLIQHKVLSLLSLIALVIAASTSVSSAQGGGGTAKPPKGAVAPWTVASLPTPLSLTVPANTAVLHGFDETGLIQSASVSGAACPALAPAAFGGSVVLNGRTVTIPCNLIIQMPANTLTWADFVNGSSVAGAVPLAGLELSLVGNMVGPRYIAALAYVSQLSLDGGTGKITGFDYANGTMLVDDAAGATVRVQLNDPVVPGLVNAAGNPTGRFSAGQSPDPRFSVDQDNPTVHGGTGYPMCIPRTDPAVGADPLCPQGNRPLAAAGCRNFGAAGVALPAGGELGAPTAAQTYCTQWVMNNPAVSVASGDARQQAPFEVGDYVNYAGTWIGADGSRIFSAHTVEANVGIYTQPGTQPAYMAIGDFGVGSADPAATAVNGVGQETQNRIFLEAETTDVKTPVDIYYEDHDATLGTRSRWITPTEMTGENAAPAVGPTGGITTQNTGAQAQRARLRATKAPVGLLTQPSRTVRVAQRTLCLPTPLSATGLTIDQGALDGCFATNETPARTRANGLAAGQYKAPVFEYIFPENVKSGDALVPYDFWHLPFLVNGEVGGPGPLVPTPW